ncbi:hypothetical protein AHF37_05743 [Paragonimus kellicotti]|nr:hypothetical protein AHF37_05743 [Paragonimus kellicotti]
MSFDRSHFPAGANTETQAEIFRASTRTYGQIHLTLNGDSFKMPPSISVYIVTTGLQICSARYVRWCFDERSESCAYCGRFPTMGLTMLNAGSLSLLVLLPNNITVYFFPPGSYRFFSHRSFFIGRISSVKCFFLPDCNFQ